MLTFVTLHSIFCAYCQLRTSCTAWQQASQTDHVKVHAIFCRHGKHMQESSLSVIKNFVHLQILYTSSRKGASQPDAAIGNNMPRTIMPPRSQPLHFNSTSAQMESRQVCPSSSLSVSVILWMAEQIAYDCYNAAHLSSRCM